MQVLSMRFVVFAASIWSAALLPLRGQQPATAPASFSLAGIVIDTMGVPVPFAQVFVFDNADRGTNADNDGRYRIRRPDRKSTRLNSSHLGISYAVFCLKKKKKR